MPKKTKTATQECDAYKLLSNPTKQVASRKVIIDDANKVHVFPSAQSIIPPDVIIGQEFKDMDDFMKRGKATIKAHHAERLGIEVPKGTSTEQAAFMVWAWFVKNGTPHLEGTNSEGEKVRKSSIGETLYLPGTSSEVPALPFQAKVSLDLFHRCIEKRASVTEAELRAFVEANGAELKTKQPAWRIFQYYRPKLIGAKLMRRQ